MNLFNWMGDLKAWLLKQGRKRLWMVPLFGAIGVIAGSTAVRYLNPTLVSEITFGVGALVVIVATTIVWSRRGQYMRLIESRIDEEMVGPTGKGAARLILEVRTRDESAVPKTDEEVRTFGEHMTQLRRVSHRIFAGNYKPDIDLPRSDPTDIETAICEIRQLEMHARALQRELTALTAERDEQREVIRAEKEASQKREVYLARLESRAHEGQPAANGKESSKDDEPAAPKRKKKERPPKMSTEERQAAFAHADRDNDGNLIERDCDGCGRKKCYGTFVPGAVFNPGDEPKDAWVCTGSVRDGRRGFTLCEQNVGIDTRAEKGTASKSPDAAPAAAS